VVYVAWALSITAIVAAQSASHLVLVLDAGRIGTFIDLDRSNGLPDLFSTFVLAVASGGAAALALRETAGRRLVASFVAALLGALTVADVLHDGAHPSRATGPLVITLVVCTVALLLLVAVDAGTRVLLTLAVAVCLLAGSFLVTGLDRLDRWFERERGDEVAEVEIVTKEGLELAGWALVALALWDEAIRRRPPRGSAVIAGARLSPRPDA
jgi:asparagine N-glycosylation enzyme membrane subunit Stt3